MGFKEVRIGNVNGGAILTRTDVLETLNGFIFAGIVALVLRIVGGISVGIIGQPEQIGRYAILFQALHILKWDNPAQILIVYMNHFRFCEFPRRKEGSLRSSYTGARRLTPVRQVIQSIQLVYVAELVHAVHARLNGGHLREGAIAAQEQTHPLHRSHVLRIKPVGQANQRVIVAKGQLLGGDVDEGLELSSRYHHGYGLGQEISQLRAETGEGL